MASKSSNPYSFAIFLLLSYLPNHRGVDPHLILLWTIPIQNYLQIGNARFLHIQISLTALKNSHGFLHKYPISSRSLFLPMTCAPSTALVGTAFYPASLLSTLLSVQLEWGCNSPDLTSRLLHVLFFQ